MVRCSVGDIWHCFYRLKSHLQDVFGPFALFMHTSKISWVGENNADDDVGSDKDRSGKEEKRTQAGKIPDWEIPDRKQWHCWRRGFFWSWTLFVTWPKPPPLLQHVLYPLSPIRALSLLKCSYSVITSARFSSRKERSWVAQKSSKADKNTTFLLTWPRRTEPCTFLVSTGYIHHVQLDLPFFRFRVTTSKASI